jgi:hypothetical protein
MESNNMQTSPACIKLLAAASLVAMVVPGCSAQQSPVIVPAKTPATTLSATYGDRTVKLTADTAAFVSSKDDTATLTLPNNTVVIEKNQVLLNGVKTAEIPGEAKLVKVDVISGKLSVTADDGASTTAMMKTP